MLFSHLRNEAFTLKIIIPAYQPDTRLLQLIDQIKADSDYGIIIVNDGSAPECNMIFEAAANKGCTILSHKENRGKGAALKTAFSYLAKANETEGFVCCDCDGQHTWNDIRKIAQLIPANKDTVILGCRNFIGKVPLKSKFGNKLTKSIFYLITGSKITDTQTGLRGFSSDMLDWLLSLDGSRYEYEMNQLLQAKKSGYTFLCVPIDTIYENNNKGSHFHPVKDSIRVYLPIVRFSMSSILCGILDFALLFIMKAISGNLLLSVITARVISSLSNYMLNKHLVFRHGSGKQLASLLQYYLLAAFILVMNYLLISFLNETLHLPLIISKLLTEALLFGISYTVQHKVIFKK